MAWSLERKVRVYPRPPFVTFWDYSWCISCYGAFVGSAVTKRGARKALWNGQAEMFVDGR